MTDRCICISQPQGGTKAPIKELFFSDISGAVSLKALCTGSLIFAIEGNDVAESCWLWQRKV